MARAKEDANTKPLHKLPLTFSFAWLDSNNIEYRTFTESFSHDLGIPNRSWSYYDKKESFLQVLKALKPPHKLILISSGTLAKEIIDDVHHLEQLYSIYVFCQNIPTYSSLMEKYSKVISVQSDRELLHQKLRADLSTVQVQEAARSAAVPPKHDRFDPTTEDNNVESFAQPGKHWCPWNSKTCSQKLPLPGQGTVEIMLEKPIPFELRISNKENPTDPNAYIISLSVDEVEAKLTVQDQARDSSQLTTHTLHRDDGKWHTYWLSLFKDTQTVKYGVGEVRDAFTIFNISLPDQEKDLFKQVAYLHVKMNKNDNMLTEVSKFKENVRFFLGKEPVVTDPAMFVVPQDTYSIGVHSAIPPSKLAKPCRDLYDDVANFNLNTGFPKFVEAIEESLKNPNGWCHKKLIEKANRFGRPNIKATYLRITHGLKSGTAPGHTYVIEIWPPGHYSPIHSHSNAYGIIRVLHGRLLVKLFPELTTKPFQYPPVEQILDTNKVTWMLPKLNQTHQVRNADLDGSCAISIQCYQYGHEDDVHYEYFDYLSNDGLSIQHFDPKSDMDYDDFKKLMKEESTK